jgi:hypothetical protein
MSKMLYDVLFLDPMQGVQNLQAYFAMAGSYEEKMFMKWTPG